MLFQAALVVLLASNIDAAFIRRGKIKQRTTLGYRVVVDVTDDDEATREHGITALSDTLNSLSLSGFFVDVEGQKDTNCVQYKGVTYHAGERNEETGSLSYYPEGRGYELEAEYNGAGMTFRVRDSSFTIDPDTCILTTNVCHLRKRESKFDSSSCVKPTGSEYSVVVDSEKEPSPISSVIIEGEEFVYDFKTHLWEVEEAIEEAVVREML